MFQALTTNEQMASLAFPLERKESQLMCTHSRIDVKEQINRHVRELTRLDNWHSVVYLTLDYLIIIAMIALSLRVSFWFYPVSWLVIGSRQRGLANLLHAAAHGTLARNRKWNFISGTFLSGYLIGQQFVRYHHSHVVSHHGRFGDPHSDPDYRQHIALGLYQFDSRKHNLKKEIYRTALGLNIPGYIAYVLNARLLGKVPEKYDNRIVSQRTDQLLFYTWWAMIIVTSLSLGVFDWLLLFWFIPLCSSAMMIGWFIELAEHYPLMSPKAKAAHATRNRHGNWLERLLTGVHNDHYHLEHHLSPKVPMWNLPTTNHVRQADPDYRERDNQCGGIFSKKDALVSRKTLLQYVFAKAPGASDSFPGVTSYGR